MSDIKIESEAQIYLEEFSQKLTEIESHILSFADDNTKKTNNLKMMSHIVHSLKGTAGCYGFDLLSVACHKMEDLIVSSDFSSMENLIDELLKIKDIMTHLCEAYRKEDLPSLEMFRRHFGVSHTSSHTPYLTLFANSSNSKLPTVEQKRIKVLVSESSKLIRIKFLQVPSQFDV
jgi:chemotaxis protein histidine kinase CheA